MQYTCAEDYNVYKNKIYILNVRIDPESAFSKLLVVFVWCIFTMNGYAWCYWKYIMQKNIYTEYNI